MTTDSKNESLWMTQQQINDHLRSFGQPGYGRDSGKVKGATEDSISASDILVRKAEGEIVVIAGSQRLEVKLQEFGHAKVKFPSGREAIVVRTPDGQLAEN
jgi:hypothetical protein